MRTAIIEKENATVSMSFKTHCQFPSVKIWGVAYGELSPKLALVPKLCEADIVCGIETCVRPHKGRSAGMSLGLAVQLAGRHGVVVEEAPVRECFALPRAHPLSISTQGVVVLSEEHQPHPS